MNLSGQTAVPLASITMDPSKVKLLDFDGSRRLLVSGGMKMLRAYQNRFFFSKGRQGAPIFHVMLVTGIVGYSLEYSHLSMCFIAMAVKLISL